MSNAATQSAVVTVQIGSHSYAVERTTRPVVPYLLRGPRGGAIEAVATKGGRFALMQNGRTLRAYGVEVDGVFTVVDPARPAPRPEMGHLVPKPERAAVRAAFDAAAAEATDPDVRAKRELLREWFCNPAFARELSDLCFAITSDAAL